MDEENAKLVNNVISIFTSIRRMRFLWGSMFGVLVGFFVSLIVLRDVAEDVHQIGFAKGIVFKDRVIEKLSSELNQEKTSHQKLKFEYQKLSYNFEQQEESHKNKLNMKLQKAELECTARQLSKDRKHIDERNAISVSASEIRARLDTVCLSRAAPIVSSQTMQVLD